MRDKEGRSIAREKRANARAKGVGGERESEREN